MALIHAVSRGIHHRLDDSKCLQRSWVAESLSEVTLDLVLRRQVDLLEQLGADADAARSAYPLERFAVVHVFMEMVVGVACTTAVSIEDSQDASGLRSGHAIVEVLVYWFDKGVPFP
jgi:hypothetical protein